MTYTEKELDQFLHGISLSLLSKESAQHWRYDEETAREIEWLEALERKVRADKADRKTENSSEKPNNCKAKNYCDDCLYTDTCDSKEFFYACTSKATISKMEQVEDEPQTPMCETCRYDEPNNPKCDECIAGEDKPSNYEPDFWHSATKDDWLKAHGLK